MRRDNAFIWLAVMGGTKTLEDTENLCCSLILSDIIDIPKALLAILVVRGLTARLLERFRRVRDNSPRVLAEAGIQLPVAE